MTIDYNDDFKFGFLFGYVDGSIHCVWQGIEELVTVINEKLALPMCFGLKLKLWQVKELVSFYESAEVEGDRVVFENDPEEGYITINDDGTLKWNPCDDL